MSNWSALTKFLDNGAVLIDNNATENAILPLTLGRKNSLHVGLQAAGERAAVLVNLIELAKLNGHAPWAYLQDAFERQPTLTNRELAQFLPHDYGRLPATSNRQPPPQPQRTRRSSSARS